jgi:hypothetical protein
MRLDPDPYSHFLEDLDPDPASVNMDPNHCWYRYFKKDRYSPQEGSGFNAGHDVLANAAEARISSSDVGHASRCSGPSFLMKQNINLKYRNKETGLK